MVWTKNNWMKAHVWKTFSGIMTERASLFSL